MRRAALLLLVLVIGCGAPFTGGSRRDRGSLSYVALGDAYTLGDGAAVSLRWPLQLAHLLRVYDVPVEDPTIVAGSDWTTDDLAAAIRDRHLSHRFNLVTLMIGSKDEMKDRNTEAFRRSFRRDVRAAVRLAHGHAGRVVVLSIPDRSVTPSAAGSDREAIARQIDAYNEVIREEVVAAGAHYVDVTTFSRDAAEHPELISGDGLHPSGMMLAEWARITVPAARTAIGE